MYTVGPWFVYLMNLAVLAIVGIIVLVVIQVKKNQYLKDAAGKIQVEIWLTTGYREYHTIPCDLNAKTITVGSSTYILNPKRIRWGRHPRLPFMGLASMQVPIRLESWFQGVKEPIAHPKEEVKSLTAPEIRALMRQGRATLIARHSQLLEAGQKGLVNAIANQPNKVVLYVMLGVAIIGIAIIAFNTLM